MNEEIITSERVKLVDKAKFTNFHQKIKLFTNINI